MDTRVDKLIAMLRRRCNHEAVQVRLLREQHDRQKHQAGCRNDELLASQQECVDEFAADLAALED